MSGQANTEFTEPPREEIPGISKAHVAAMEASDADVIWIAAGMSHLVLRTIGRKSGNEHKVALPFWRDPDGGRIVVGSFAGAPEHPSWFLNLLDRSANPEVHVRTQTEEYWSDQEVLDGDDYDATWALLVVDRPFYQRYTERTTRRIPLIRLRETRSV
jgi:deazaflavin-dependent oxidoreductase (nitroreductase family)